jgi:signal transduction histidine kinase
MLRQTAGLILLLLLANPAALRAAPLPPPPDSLRAQLRNAKTPAERGDVLLRIAQAYFGPFDSVMVMGYALAAEQAAHQAGDAGLEGQAVDLRGSYFMQAGDLKRAQPLLLRAERLLRAGVLHPRVNNLRNLGDLYVDMNRSGQALQYFRRAYALAGGLPMPDRLDQQGSLLNSIGAFYYRQDRLDSTIVYLFRALKLKQQVRDTLGEAAALGNLAACFLKQQRYAEAARYARRGYALEYAAGDSVAFSQTLGYLVKIAAARDSLPTALRLCRQQYRLFRHLKMDAALPGVDVTLARLYARLQQHDSVVYHYQRAATGARRVGAGAEVGEAISNLASYHLERGRLAEAETWARQGLALDSASTTATSTQLLRKVMQQLAERRGNYQQAYRYLQQRQQLEQREQAHNNQQLTEDLRVRYETDQAEQQVQLLQATQRGLRQQTELQRLRRQREVGGLAALLLLLGGGLWQVRRRRAALARQHAALEQANTALAEQHATLEQTTRALQEATRAKDRLYAIVAHDLRGPLTSFDGLVQLLHRYLDRGRLDELPPLLGQARLAVDRLSELLNNLLGWAASQTGELAFRPRRLLVAELFEEVMALYAPTAKAGGVALVADAATGLHLHADQQMSRTILRNLVGNALRATPAGGSVRLQAQAGAGTVVLSVADTGPGLPPALLARLQSPGQPEAEPDPTEPAPHGTGLGLRLCRLFAERHGGRLRAANAPAGGAVLGVELPADA